MILVLVAYFFICITLVMLFIFSKKVMRKVSLALLILFFIVPVSFILFLALCKTPIQEGRILADFGPLLLLFAPPEDLWQPLAHEEIKGDKRIYKFRIFHKYVGNHCLVLSFDRLGSMQIVKHDLKMRFLVRKEETVLCDKTLEKAWPYWGRDESGLTFYKYKVPQDLPIREPFVAEISIQGDIEEFIEHYGTTELILRKASDE